MASRAERFDVHKRHSDLKEFIEISESFTNMGFCLVAGNSAYLNEVEKSKSVFGIVDLSKYISDNASNGLDVFIGAENCINPTIAILRRFAAGNGYKHNYIPFILKSETSVDELQIINRKFNTGTTFALYTPYLFTNSNNGITKRLCEYILRRKKVQGELGLTHNNCSELTTLNELDSKSILLKNYADKLSLHGDFDAITNEIAALYKSGFSYIVGLALNDSLKQILSLKKASLRANALLLA